jgi:raffinose/stachyose/melibiose transport system permease protein
MKKITPFIRSILGILLSLLVVLPFLAILLNSFKTKKEAAEMTIALPTEWNIVNNYVEVFQTGLLKAFGNSTLVTLLSVTLIILTTALASFVLQRRQTAAMSRLKTLFIIGLILPGQIIPTYMICNFLGVKSFLGAAVVLTAANIPLGVFMYMGFLKSIPISIDEAAIVDGCSPIQLVFKVIFPLLKPMTITLFILNFMNIWNDFGTTIYFLNRPQNYTLTLTIYNFFSTHSSDWNLVFADVVAVSLPVIIVYFSAQKHIMSGMTSGAVKG